MNFIIRMKLSRTNFTTYKVNTQFRSINLPIGLNLGFSLTLKELQSSYRLANLIETFNVK